ncbi:ketoacyl-ACP synthase III [Treponema sp.]|uniref:3-oxoacyl-ACP synthase III family protein n=1 Tax=Treponema sp. TaxID=166 RepID=UPI00298E996C|nr:ketoacyl-ACP synthase III [Treponema sp.]MCQ2241392.1 ketoacyl-ACP synthase III [Treponema sp.]
MHTIIHNARIVGVSCVIPKKSKSLYDEPNLYEGNQKKIKRVIESSGFLNRRVADANVTTSDLCFKAAEDLLSNLQINKSEIDALLFISYTPDYLMPATSYVLHNRLGLSENCICMDIPQACSGYEIGLYQAGNLINNGCNNVLLLVGDTFSKFSDMFSNNSAPVFGDSGTATLITKDESANPWYFNIKTDSSGYDALICKNGGFRNPVSKEKFYEDGSFKYESKMDGARVFDFTMKRVKDSIIETMSFANTSENELDFLVLHQANKMIMQNIANELNFPEEKVPIGTMTEFGNQCGASIPCTFSYKLNNKLQNQNNRVLLSGFGVGLSWATCVVDLNKIYCSELIEY